MHVEIPEGRIESLKAFAAHYLMIVLSILTALALEESLLHLHHAESGRQAQAQIEAEVRDNLKDLRAAIADNVRNRQPLTALNDRLVAALKSGLPDAKIRSDIIEPAKSSIRIGISWPQLRHAAWDVALANQSATYIDPQRLKPISALYSAQREFATGLQGSAVLLNGGSMVDTLTDLRIGDESPRALLHALSQMNFAIAASQSNLADMQSLLEAVSVDAPHASGHNSPASAASVPN